MIKNKLLATCTCLAATLLISTSAEAKTVDLNDNGIAGFSYIIDNYYKIEEESLVATQMEARTIEPTSTDAVNEVAVKSDEKVANKDKTSNKKEKKETKKEETVTKMSAEEKKYADIGVSVAENYVRIRKEPNTDSEVMGKLYRGCVANILKTEGDWVKIKSGNVEGYIKSEFLAIGDLEVIDEYAMKVATVTTTTLKVREKKSVDSTCLTLIPLGEVYPVEKEFKDWVKISIDDETGYVSKDYVELSYEYEYAISIEEEEAKIKAEQEAIAQEQARLEEQQRQQAQQSQSNKNQSNNSSNSSSSSNSSQSSKPSSSSSNNSNSSSSNSGSGSASSIASYALNFVGNPYVYGGTSLTNGTDCSGFTQSVFKKFGISLPRTSGEQASSGSRVEVSNLQAGDIVYYTSGGRVNHVAIYIGNGKVVHASNPRDGIKVSKYNYRKPAGARRYK